MADRAKKVLLVGNGQRGKTEFAKKTRIARYVPTQGVEVHPFRLDNEEPRIKLWDTAGVEKYAGLRDGYYIGADAALIFADDEKEAKHWLREVLRVCDAIPILVLAKEENVGKFPNFPAINKEKKTAAEIFAMLFGA